MFNNCIVFCDFDGTITKKDTLDIIVDNYLGEDYRKYIDNCVIDGKIQHDHGLTMVFDKINCSLKNAVKLINKNNIDEHFIDFYGKCIENNIEIYIVSSGFKTFIKYLLPDIDEKIIYSNDVVINDNNWNIQFYNGDELDKSKIIKQLSGNKKTIYFGDGVSDIKVADKVNKLFVKSGSNLETYCIDHNIEYQQFSNFKQFSNIKYISSIK